MLGGSRMLDWLVKIPGSEFLTYFGLMSLIGIGVGWWLVRGRDDGYPLPDKNQFDPTTFAVLRGRWQIVIDMVVVQLIERNVVGIAEKVGKKTLFIKKKTIELSPVEQVVYNYLLVSKTVSQFDCSDMKVSMENALQPVYRELERIHLYKTGKEVFYTKLITYFMMFCLDILVISKIYFAIIYNKPFSFLVILMLLMSFSIFRIVKPGDRVTQLGYKYMREVSKHFSWLKTDLGKHSKGRAALHNYVLGTAIFGVGILASSEIFDGYQAFAVSKRYTLSDGVGNYYGSGDSGGSGGGCSGCGGCGGGN